MEDLNFLKGFFGVLKGVMYVIFVILGILFIVNLFNYNLFGLGFCVVIALGCGLLMVEILIGEIILTRFVAMTENVLEITEMLEKKFEITNK